MSLCNIFVLSSRKLLSGQFPSFHEVLCVQLSHKDIILFMIFCFLSVANTNTDTYPMQLPQSCNCICYVICYVSLTTIRASLGFVCLWEWAFERHFQPEFYGIFSVQLHSIRNYYSHSFRISIGFWENLCKIIIWDIRKFHETYSITING